MPETASTMRSETVRPLGSRWESALLAAALTALVLFTGAYAALFGREDAGEGMLDWQLSAYSDLGGADQAIYNQLLVAAEEIAWLLEDTGSWPAVARLEEVFLAPFYRDQAWQRNGAVQWSFAARGDDADLGLYHGSGGNLETQGAYLMMIERNYAGNAQIVEPSIWWHPDPQAPVPEAAGDNSLILAGWKEIVPYRGSDERQRLTGRPAAP